MTDSEVERYLGCTPCVCGRLDGTWHRECYLGKTNEQLEAGRKRVFAAARKHIKKQAVIVTSAILDRSMTPNSNSYPKQ
jgi:hypothetical protein